MVLDVRNDPGYQIARIPGSVFIPLPELPQRLGELPRHATIVCHCHTGKRSLVAARLLLDHGFGEVLSLAGGIDAWSRHVDNSIARY